MADTLRSLRSWFPPYVGACTGLVALALGVWLVLPFNTFHSSPSLHLLAANDHEELIGLILIGAAVIGARSHATHHQLLETCAVATLAGIWCYLGAATAVSNPLGPGWPVYAALCVLDTWVVLTFLQNAREVDGAQ